MELRCPDPACNPYLTFAILLAAGLEGIEKGYELPEPMDKNLYHISPEERKRLGIEQLPETLGEAIEMTAESELCCARSASTYSTLRGDQATGVGGLPGPGDPVGARSLPGGAVGWPASARRLLACGLRPRVSVRKRRRAVSSSAGVAIKVFIDRKTHR